MDPAVWLTLLHILVFVYWLGGDLGAFVAALIVADPARPPAARAAGAQVLARVDVAPRAALILAAPTGLALAAARGWIALDPALTAAIFVLALIWLWLSIRVHLKGAAAGTEARLDAVIRVSAILALTGFGAAIAAGASAWPLFIGLKMLALAGAAALGLGVRAVLRPFGPAFGRIAAGQGGVEDEAIVGAVIGRVRVLVLGIWALLVAAAWLGVAKPA